jgi:tRNA G10  N-methylase Trm11
MYIAILGRQPALSMAELEHLYGADAAHWFSDQAATVKTNAFFIDRLGGTQKAGKVAFELGSADWRDASTKIIQHYAKKWSGFEGKITLGISAYGFTAKPTEIQKTGIVLKQKLKKNEGGSLRLIPNPEAALNTAASHHNKLGLSPNKVELLVIRARNGRVIVAESIGAQNITALALRDQKRPKRDAFVGMLPPKLAQLMINLAASASNTSQTLGAKEALVSESFPHNSSAESTPLKTNVSTKGEHRILDPFCGTGVVLQEAMLMGYSVYGTDLSEKMIDYTQENLSWLMDRFNVTNTINLHAGDAMDTKWQPPIDAVVCEGYLGQPFSAPPSLGKLEEVRKNCNHIMSSFLKNIASQLESGTPLCVAIPAWRDTNGTFTHLPLINDLEKLGYTRFAFKNVKNEELLYYREDQIVARELLVLVKS